MPRLLIALKFVWLKILNASPRSWSCVFSPKRKFLNKEKSTRLVGGPLITARPAFPTTFAIGAALGLGWKHATVNHCSKVCGAPLFGSHRTFGLLPATRAGMLPSPAASKFVVGVKPNPDCNFFFQAEDGIRDLTVTGVQTCALPI